jgi:starch synthase
MKILMVASEATPFAKTGGLADVIGALPHALAARGEQVAVVMPLYKGIHRFQPEWVRDRADIQLTPSRIWPVTIRRVNRGDVPFFFIECPPLFERDELYGESGEDYTDNHVRFTVFCRAALGIVRSLFRPDILHCHDWQAAMTGPLMRHQFRLDPTFSGIRMLMTVHNLGYQGLFPREALADLGFGKELFHPERMEFWGRINFLKAGLVYADAISTVSKAYAREIQTAEHGFGLEGLLRSRAAVLTGILNGVDYSEWNPETDALLAANYSVGNLSGKRACKADLLRTFGLPTDNLDRPVIGIVSRFVGQKGFDLIAGIGDELMREDIFLTAIGTGEPQYEAAMQSLAERYSDKAAVRIAYNNEIAHKIEAGSDIFLMPSRYEPCGLNQIYSLRYGTVPVVRATGGLEDTIDESTGFRFSEYSGAALLAAIRAALAAYRQPRVWSRLVETGMRRDHSWAASAAEYSALYRRIAEPESFSSLLHP